ncbi:MAG: glutaredoxin 3 [Halothiobacillus sp.]|jgi:glutaredoxin 3|uniref:glutaredoxin 3 n=1 Tax=Halothiobacillus sp. TaxID=1891311 RepID=UPI002AD378AE|nr:glutaredoxin 3 [Halothiobacillus sp.]MDA3878685.1 glutaredoxin 3 [Halothiobacillus sp.]
MSHSVASRGPVLSSPLITLYFSNFCPYCHFAKRLLKQDGLAFEAVSVDFSRDRRAEMEARSGRESVPQIFIGATHVGGYDDLAAMKANGQLAVILAKERGEVSAAPEEGVDL